MLLRHRYLFRKSVSSDAVDVDIVRETERMESRRLSFRRKSLSSPLSKTSITDSLIPSGNRALPSLLVERDIRYYIEALPYTVPGCHLHVPAPCALSRRFRSSPATFSSHCRQPTVCPSATRSA